MSDVLNQNQSITFEVLVTYRFNTSNLDSGNYRCYATVTNSLKSGLLVREQVIIAGYADMYVRAKQKLLVTGVFTGMDTYRGPMKVFKISRVRPAKDRTSLLAYFSGDKFAGIGKSRAEDIIDTLGLDCLQVIQDDPDCLNRVASLSDEMRQNLKQHICDDDMEMTFMKLCPGISAKFLAYMTERHGKDWRHILDTDPYILLNESDECKAITFEFIDTIGKKLNIAQTSIHRIRYCVRDVIKSLGERGVNGLTFGGNLFVNLTSPEIRAYFIERVSGLLNIDWAVIQKAIESGDAGVKLLNVYGPKYDGQNYSQICGCYLSEKLKDEAAAGEILRNAVCSKSILAKATNQEILKTILDYNTDFCAGALLTPEQMLAIQTAMKSRVSVLTGGPGSGKTTVIRGIIYAWQKLSRDGIVDNNLYRGSVSLAAPTGMAVRRMNDAVAAVKPDGNHISDTDMRRIDEATNQYTWESKTLASYVFAVKNKKTDIESLVTLRARGINRLVIIDEMSMVSMSDFAMMLRLMPDAQFVFVGDIDQLPSISAGEVLWNLCNTGRIPVSRLTINHRSKGAMAINENMAKIRNGDATLKSDPGVFDISLFAHEDETMLNSIVDAYMNELNRVNSLSDIAMIAPRNIKGTCSVSHLNTIIRNKLNPVAPAGLNTISTADELTIFSDGHEVPVLSYMDNVDNKSYKLRIGDRVVITENNSATGAFDKSGHEVEASVVNGDRGYIRKYQVKNPGKRNAEHWVFIELDDGRLVVMCDEKLKHIELAYATTVHKAQGCEYDSVIFVAQGGMCYGVDFATRNLIYTAITRAKRHCLVMGLKSTIDYCIASQRPIRNSMLAFRVAGML